MRKGVVDTVYKTSPVWIQNIIVSVYGYLRFKERYGPVYRKKFNEYIRKDYSSLETEIAEQNKSLRDFIQFVNQHSNYYRDLYKGIDLSKIKEVKDLKLLPVVTKEDLRSNLEKVYTLAEKDSNIGFTGGTTGKSMMVRFTREDTQIRMAYLDAWKFGLGIDPFKVKKATFSGRSVIHKRNPKKFWRHNYTYRQRLYSTFHITQETIPVYIKNLNKYKPDVINGFVSAIYELAEYINRNSVDLRFTPKAIFTTSETLTTLHRSVIEKAFRCKVYDQYASAEGAPFITECKKGNLHYNLDTGVVERNDNGEMIVTSFTTRGTPLIRYNIADKVFFKAGSCSCGNSHPLVERIEGRAVDFLYNSEGGKVSLSHLADVIKGNPNSVIKMQFIQKSKKEVTVLLVVDKTLYNKSDESTILSEMRYRFGEEMKITMKVVDEIPREGSGKYQLIKNLVDPNS